MTFDNIWCDAEIKFISVKHLLSFCRILLGDPIIKRLFRERHTNILLTKHKDCLTIWNHAMTFDHDEAPQQQIILSFCILNNDLTFDVSSALVTHFSEHYNLNSSIFCFYVPLSSVQHGCNCFRRNICFLSVILR